MPEPRNPYQNENQNHNGHFRRGVVGFVAAATLLGISVPAAWAASAPVWAKKNIEFSAYTAKGVSGYVENGTTYMPIWYVLQALKKSGYQYSFNGKVLNITPPSGVTPDTAGLVVGTGNLSIEFAGKLVKKVQTEVRHDGNQGVLTQYIPIYYIQEILSALSFYNKWDGTNWTGRPVIASLQGSSSVKQGQMAAYVLSLEDENQNLFIPADSVKWSVAKVGGGSGASIDASTGLFTANVPGIYDVTASVDGFHMTKEVHVYGLTTGVVLSQSTKTLLTDGQAEDVITVQAVDQAGNPVGDFIGQVTLTIPATGGTFVGGVNSSTESQVTATLYNGVGTVTLTAPSSATTSQTITSSDLTSLTETLPTNLSYGTLNVVYGTPVVSQIGISPSNSTLASSGTIISPSGGSQIDATNQDNLNVTLEDAAGNAFTGTLAPVNVTLTLKGPGSFQPGFLESQETEYIYPGSTGITVPVYGLVNQSGTITVTASGGGVTGTATIVNDLSASTPQLKITKTSETLTTTEALSTGGGQTKTFPAGTPYSLYTVAVVDGNGNPLPQGDTLYISDNTVSATNTTDALWYYTVSGTSLPGSMLTPVSPGMYSISTSPSSGRAQFIVINEGNAPSSSTITVKDSETGATAVTNP